MKSNIFLSCLIIIFLGYSNPVFSQQDDIIPAEQGLESVYEMIYNNKLDEAEKLLNNLKNIEGNNPEYHLYLALIKHKQGLFDRALVEYFKASHFDKDGIILNYNLALLFQEMNNYPKALELYKNIAKKHPEYYKTFYNIARIYQEQGDNAKAKVYYDKFIKKYPEDIETLNNLAVIYKDEGHLDKAQSLLQQIILDDPGYAPAHYNIALIYILKEDSTKARNVHKLLQKLSPDHAKILEYQLKKQNIDL
jgi:tetratricopeptide (TPR) repeat protein